jgi:NAD(P)-dependent dehydrogenase (short-subunit alcohol dehydrogenase family)
MIMSLALDGKVVVVTGATGGIGTATVHRLAAEGATVVITDLSKHLCEQLSSFVQAGGGSAVARPLDVTDEAAWSGLVGDICRTLGRIDGLVNNAGVSASESVTSLSVSEWQRVLAVSQTGVWLGMKHVGLAIELAGGGAIVNMSSIFGTVGGFGQSFAYHAAKGAVRTMTKNAAIYWAGAGVRVNSVHPGFVATDAYLRRFADTEHHAVTVAEVPMGRLAEPEEIAAAITFLLSNDSTFITGSELYVDGGWTAR